MENRQSHASHATRTRLPALIPEERSSSASSAKLNHAAASPVLDPRHYRGSSPTKTSPALHHYQPPPYTGDHTSIPALYDDLFAGSLMHSPELSRRLPCSPNPETVRWCPPRELF
ncbi:hypothetical protein CgunFtcFv8_016997 [Champsocephalus gunnari]|uniref:Uncharacterized protein n=1 Tax=Champsocephalus gunnari TaxID=52237 RepID=A0AAN8CV42_CHAGU|nr:hypothetical protein CgunFtcFv8_016997 [Champsocephalus gunnari]